MAYPKSIKKALDAAKTGRIPHNMAHLIIIKKRSAVYGPSTQFYAKTRFFILPDL
jgi:hypothetical protein